MVEFLQKRAENEEKREETYERKNARTCDSTQRVFLEPLRSARQLSRSWSVAGAHVQAVKQERTNNDV